MFRFLVLTFLILSFSNSFIQEGEELLHALEGETTVQVDHSEAEENCHEHNHHDEREEAECAHSCTGLHNLTTLDTENRILNQSSDIDSKVWFYLISYNDPLLVINNPPPISLS